MGYKTTTGGAVPYRQSAHAHKARLLLEALMISRPRTSCFRRFSRPSDAEWILSGGVRGGELLCSENTFPVDR
jgi:hypothetical protein